MVGNSYASSAGSCRPSHSCEFTGETDQLRRSQSVAGERFPDVYLVRFDFQQLGKFAIPAMPGSSSAPGSEFPFSRCPLRSASCPKRR